MNRFKLFCLPYAGGSAMNYSSWRIRMPPWVEVIPIEMAGRGIRLADPFYKSLTGDGTDDLVRQIAEHLDETPFAIFGHSMGALFAYEASLRIFSVTNRSPAHVFLSGCKAPHLRDNKNVHLMPDKEFQEHILQLGGTSPDIFENKDLSMMFLPILRADYRLVETYESAMREKLDCDITVLYGAQDRYSRHEAEEWKHYTKRKCHVNEFQGNHFFIHTDVGQVVELICHQIDDHRWAR
ncbi:thioesterase II family protein [Paenibacillus sp. 2TAB23]|uniref:thioesterase II family protein n=1 Tax=Paenibacillus sp. 2TAB23 TaxID=3233004 RepID=UPI003F9D20EC